MVHASHRAAVSAFRDALYQRPLLFVAGGSTAGRAHVAAAAGLALARSKRTLLVDADFPAHGLGDALGVQLPVMSSAAKRLEIPGLPTALEAVKLCGPQTQKYLLTLLAADKWRSLLEHDNSLKMATSFGLPIKELAQLLSAVRTPPGAEMPIALARLLAQLGASSLPTSGLKKKYERVEHVVVDAGAAALAAQLQHVPVAVSEGLQGFLMVHRLIKSVKDAAMPAAMTSGLRMLVGREVRENASAQMAETLRNIEQLHAAMASLARTDSSVLLVLPYAPGKGAVGAAQRLIDALRPSCIALTHFPAAAEASSAPRPDWIPDHLPVLTLPWGNEKPQGLDELSRLADAMSLLDPVVGNSDYGRCLPHLENLQSESNTRIFQGSSQFATT
eukprot:TRINITY_DN90453_c0_g1_i1.p1 TRINITY_DN90453_c0_g1~~TRINITY_DN90453_c0_g1_i1.p1  ORF type:complete len:389 (-),score=74.07 TRINITY_DN90453_c0_g1_i1:184-1350(-)